MANLMEESKKILIGEGSLEKDKKSAKSKLSKNEKIIKKLIDDIAKMDDFLSNVSLDNMIFNLTKSMNAIKVAQKEIG